MAKVTVRIDTKNLNANLRQWGADVEMWPYRIAQYYAPQMEAFAKQERPWIDRTGNARAALAGHAIQLERGKAAMVLVHGMEYGKSLELERQGRYAIIKPTVERYYATLKREVGFQ